jgi:hypothetical protein
VLGGLVGAIDGAMSISGHPWFNGMDTHSADQHLTQAESQAYKDSKTQTVDQQSKIFNAAPSEKDATDTGSFVKALSIGFILWDMMKGVLWIKGIIDDTIIVNNPEAIGSENQNLFSDFSMVIQIGIWCIYGMGALQYWNKVMLKYAY